MSILNIALQNCALMRNECSSNIEQILRSANSMKEIRNKAEKNGEVKTAWLISVQPLLELLQERTTRLSLNDKKFIVEPPATDAEVKRFEENVREVVCGEIQLGQYQEKHLSTEHGYKEFLEAHCRERSYLFQIRKCNNLNCCRPRRADMEFPWIPDPMFTDDKQHYKEMETLLGTETSDKDQPSSQKTRPSAVAEQIQGMRNAGLVAQNVRATTRCYKCEKPRCIYSKKKLSIREMRSLNRSLEKYDYSCGTQIIPEGDILVLLNGKKARIYMSYVKETTSHLRNSQTKEQTSLIFYTK